jgi:hypothetical protein
MGSPARKIVRKPIASEREAVELLAPILGFLARSGITDKDLRRHINRAILLASRQRRGPAVYRIETGTLSADLLHRWMRNPKYLNQNGRPIDLPLRGETSLTSLIQENSIVCPPAKVVEFLIRFRNVRRTKDGKFRLLRRSLNYKIPNQLPFEPNYEFLVDAARSCTRGIGSDAKSPEVFWQRADSLKLTTSQTKAFLEFAETRGMLFMHEINDWLDQHGTKAPLVRRGGFKVGVGLFGICRGS